MDMNSAVPLADENSKWAMVETTTSGLQFPKPLVCCSCLFGTTIWETCLTHWLPHAHYRPRRVVFTTIARGCSGSSAIFPCGTCILASL